MATFDPEEHAKVEGRIASIAADHVEPERVDDALLDLAKKLRARHGDDDAAINGDATDDKLDAHFADYARRNPAHAAPRARETTAALKRRGGIK